VLQLFQAEWCPFSARVRERLTELGVDYVARQVAPYPEQRKALVRDTGQDEIPTLLDDDGTVVTDADAIIAYLEAHIDPWPFEADHRQRFKEHGG
jgi:glutathione S-transferase